MWKEPSSKRRAPNALECEKKRHQRDFHLCSVYAQIKVVSEEEPLPIEEVRIILNDISPQGMRVFSKHPIPSGVVCAITIEEPGRVYVRARVLGSEQLNSQTRVIASQSLPYRVDLQFLFDSEEERGAFQTYCEELATEVLRTTAPVRAT